MTVCVFGLWHLGCVTAACLAQAGNEVIGLDFDETVVGDLQAARAPLFEPGLNELIAAGLRSTRLSFSVDPAVIGDCAVIWVAFDTPVDDHDRADFTFVEAQIARIFPFLRPGAVILISSQLPVGSTRRVAQAYQQAHPGKGRHFAYSPENLRLGKAIEVFTTAERIIVGIDQPAVQQVLEPLLRPFTENLVWLSIESAEMVKHGINSFLATCVAFANEIASICERVGADAAEVEFAMRLEPRIGQRAYIRPGAGFAGGTLARDVVFLNTIGQREELKLPLLESLLPSNDAHQHWPIRRLLERHGALVGSSVAVLGLAYKPGTDTLRRSWGLALCQELTDLGALVRAFDPAIRALPPESVHIASLTASSEAALEGADAAIIATEWPEFKAVDPELCLRTMRSPRVIDPNRFLGQAFEHDSRIDYMSVGKP